jgi:hypothetical protein
MQANAPQRSEDPGRTQGIEVADARCAICGSEAIVFDEVLAEPTIELGECLHCEYRWTGVGGSLVGLPSPDSDLDAGTSEMDTPSWRSGVSNAA